MPVQAHNAHPKRRTNEGAENYAKALYELQAREPDGVGTTAVAQRLGVTPASASGMLRRLAGGGGGGCAPAPGPPRRGGAPAGGGGGRRLPPLPGPPPHSRGRAHRPRGDPAPQADRALP